MTVVLWASAFVAIRSADGHFAPGALALGRLLVASLGPAPVSATLNVVYLGLFPTTLGFTTWAYALARTTSGKMGATTYAVPTLVIIMAWLILGQVPKWLAVVGGVACLAGVAVSRSRPRPRPHPAAVAAQPAGTAGPGREYEG